MRDANSDLHLRNGVIVPARYLRWDFGPSSGPGGQHANRSNTRVGLTLSVIRCPSFSQEERRRVEDRLGDRIRSGAIRVVVDDHRSQWRNRQTAIRRMVALLDSALATPPRKRIATKPGPAARRRRRQAKQRRSETKRQRRSPEYD